jgi:c(7)-type cytochrome triheme protein
MRSALRSANGRYWLLTAIAALVWTGAVAAQALPKLPDELKLAKSADSPGQVFFNHASHVDAAKPQCTTCHPKDFKILKSSPSRAPITHEDMEKGRLCGSCHDGKKSFGLQDDCTMCHRE